MKKPNKIYNLTIVYNDDMDSVEYIEESIHIDDSKSLKIEPLIADVSEYWDEESIDLITQRYLLAKA